MSRPDEGEGAGGGAGDAGGGGAGAAPEGAQGAEGAARAAFGLLVGPLLLLLLLLLPPPPGMDAAAWRTAAVGALMALWWVTEAIPIPATALLPLVLFPVLAIRPIGEAAAPYANPIIFLFLGGFLIAGAFQRWGLHRRLALRIIRALGTAPARVIAGFMLATAVLSMWVSNTATVVMMLPIGVSVIDLVASRQDEQDRDPNFALCLMLGIAYAASIGGLGTLIGTPPNALLAGFMEQSYGVQIGFAEWMLIGVPLAAVALPVTWLLLTRWAYPIRLREIPGGSALIERELRELGPPARAEWLVGGITALVAAAWVLRPLLEERVPGLSDAGIAIAGALVLFAIPVAWRPRRFLLGWEDAEALPWGVLLLFGGGLSLADAIRETGLADWIGAALEGVGAWPLVLVVVTVTTTVVFLTEVTSNTATAAAFLPVVASLALAIGLDPLQLAVPAALAASCAFMLPVATPPNAIVYGSGHVTIPQMVYAGFWLNLILIGLITGVAMVL